MSWASCRGRIHFCPCIVLADMDRADIESIDRADMESAPTGLRAQTALESYVCNLQAVCSLNIAIVLPKSYFIKPILKYINYLYEPVSQC